MSHDDPQLRQQRLLIRSTELRYQLRGSLEILQQPAAWIDQARIGLAWLRQHPQWPAAAVVLLLVLKPRRAFSWGDKLWWLWRSVRQVQRWLSVR